MPAGIVDSHAHLTWDSFLEDRQAVIERALNAGVEQIVNVGVNIESIGDVLSLSERYQQIFAAVGVHPHEAESWDEASENALRQAAAQAKVVAIGESGLDFHYNLSVRERQLDVFARQVELARELDKPLIVHSRDAWEETFEILHRHGKGQVRGVFHCFTGNPDLLGAIAELDFYVSFSGILTFPKSSDIQAAARLASFERLLVETDCPYLAPQGKRGKRNEPSFVWLVAGKLAELRGCSIDDLAHLTATNARRLFALPLPEPVEPARGDLTEP